MNTNSWAENISIKLGKFQVETNTNTYLMSNRSLKRWGNKLFAAQFNRKIKPNIWQQFRMIVRL